MDLQKVLRERHQLVVRGSPEEVRAAFKLLT
jgi:hypothetical protein